MQAKDCFIFLRHVIKKNACTVSTEAVHALDFWSAEADRAPVDWCVLTGNAIRHPAYAI